MIFHILLVFFIGVSKIGLIIVTTNEKDVIARGGIGNSQQRAKSWGRDGAGWQPDMNAGVIGVVERTITCHSSFVGGIMIGKLGAK